MDEGEDRPKVENKCISRWEQKAKRVKKTDFDSLQEGKRRKKERTEREKDKPKNKNICISDGGRKAKRVKKTHGDTLDSFKGDSEGGDQRREEKHCISRWEQKGKRVRKTDFSSLQNTEIQEGKSRKKKERKEREKGRLCSFSFLYDLNESCSQLNEVSSNLTSHVFSEESKDKNLVFSPLSLHVVLSMVAPRYKDPIRAQILSFLGSDSFGALTKLFSGISTVVLADGSSFGGPCLACANGVWVDQSLHIEQEFKEVVQDVYKATLRQVDFSNKYEEVRTEVNLWVEEKTRSLIKDLLPCDSVTSETKRILVNAIYFKGAWTESFDASVTKDNEFHLLNGKSVRVPFMTNDEAQMISAYDGFKVLELPYRVGDCMQDGRRFRMCIFLPDAKDGLPVLVDKLVSEPKFVKNHPANSVVEVGEFLIPKFKISFGFEASKLLKRLGLALPNCQIFHESFIEVNEEGTEAAAATAYEEGSCDDETEEILEKLDFVADHPFLFLIKENISGVVLFTGIVLDPTGS